MDTSWIIIAKNSIRVNLVIRIAWIRIIEIREWVKISLIIRKWTTKIIIRN